MVDRLQLLASDLIAHASHVDGIAGDVATARDAGDTVRLDAGAYGKLCTIVPTLLGTLQDWIIGGVGTGQGSLTDTADRLRAAAADYQATDGANADDIIGVAPGTQ